MHIECPRCRTSNPEVARYCRQCGLTLTLVGGAVLGPGHAPHPAPLPTPEGMAAVDRAVHLYYRWQVAGGGRPLVGTEPLEVFFFNGGYSLQSVQVQIQGADRAGQTVLAIEREIETLARGQTAPVEVPSYELRGPVHVLRAALLRAEFGAEQ